MHATNARTHIRHSHHGLFPQRCSDCGKGFRRRTELADHRAAEHGEVAETGGLPRCPVCGKVYRQRHNMVTHLRMKHGMTAAQAAEMMVPASGNQDFQGQIS